MTRNLLPSKWQTERLNVADSTLDEIPELQQINDANPETITWNQVEGHEESGGSMLSTLQNGVLPPTPNRSKEFFRLQSVRLGCSGELIGFLGVYHGFPEDDIFWINAITFNPEFQGKGYGTELMFGLSEIIKQLGSYTGIRTYVALNNLPSLHLCVKVGLNKMLEIASENASSDISEVHVLLEKSLP